MKLNGYCNYMQKPKLERCGHCGDFTNIFSLRELQEYSQHEQNNAELVDCGCQQEQERQSTPREMMEAGIISRSEYENL